VYAVTHAATALPLKRRFPNVGVWPLLIGVQAIELLWVIFTCVGIEHIEVYGGRIHLGFLVYSHSVGSTAALAATVWVFARMLTRDNRWAWALALAVLSHIVLDIIHHEPDIRLLPIDAGPRLGFGLTLHPLADAVVEIVYGVICWWIFGGNVALLAGILVLNALDLPFMFSKSSLADQIARQPLIVTTVVLGQIVLSWVVIWGLSRRRASQLERA
jgi:hypothetical protein